MSLELLIDLHKHAQRQGPGSLQDTLRALELIDLPKNSRLKVADLGCGTGGQTVILAEQLNADIYAVDLFANFLEELDEKSKHVQSKSIIRTLEQSMDELSFEKEEFDLIWSEGAIYNIGFEKGIKEWCHYLKPKGYLAVSEITWITQERPSEIENFWQQEYPEIDTASKKIQQLEDHGYSLVGYFFLKPESWLKHYYEPMQNRYDAFFERNGHSDEAKRIVADNENEIAHYHKFKNYYSYGFYIAQKC